MNVCRCASRSSRLWILSACFLWIVCLMRVFLFFIAAVLFSPSIYASLVTKHGYAQFEQLKYDAQFTHFDWVNPHAPKGGSVRLMAFGTFDTLNPYTLKGTKIGRASCRERV